MHVLHDLLYVERLTTNLVCIISCVTKKWMRNSEETAMSFSMYRKKFSKPIGPQTTAVRILHPSPVSELVPEYVKHGNNGWDILTT